MTTLTLEVRSLKGALSEVGSRGARVEARGSLATAELPWQVLTAKRWEILTTMAGAGSAHAGDISSRKNDYLTAG